MRSCCEPRCVKDVNASRRGLLPHGNGEGESANADGRGFARLSCMKLKKKMKRLVGGKTTKRIYRAAPWVGAAVGLVAASRSGAIGSAVEKGRELIGASQAKRSEE